MADPAMVTDDLIRTRQAIFEQPDWLKACESNMALQDPETRSRNMITDDDLRAIQAEALVVWTTKDPSGPVDEGEPIASPDPERPARRDRELRPLAAVRGRRHLQPDPPRLPPRPGKRRDGQRVPKRVIGDEPRAAGHQSQPSAGARRTRRRGRPASSRRAFAAGPPVRARLRPRRGRQLRPRPLQRLLLPPDAAVLRRLRRDQHRRLRQPGRPPRRPRGPRPRSGRVGHRRRHRPRRLPGDGSRPRRGPADGAHLRRHHRQAVHPDLPQLRRTRRSPRWTGSGCSARRSVGTWPASDRKVLLISSGGLSHDPPVPRLATATPEQTKDAARRRSAAQRRSTSTPGSSGSSTPPATSPPAPPPSRTWPRSGTAS